MRKIFFITLTILCCLPVFAKTYDVSKMGADTKGKKLSTKVINKAIDKAAEEGGGTIYFPAGNYLTGAIHMKSNITLHLESGAYVKFTDDYNEYMPFVPLRWEGTFMNAFSPLIYAKDCHNLTITGRGTLDGNGFKWWSVAQKFRNKEEHGVQKYRDLWDAANPDFNVSDYYRKTIDQKFFRPPFIQFLDCNDIIIEGVKVINSPFWTINPTNCENVVIDNVTVINPSKNPKGPNTDGINPSSCKNVRISNCLISVGDDCITIKSGRDEDGRRNAKACENITITNCVMLAGHGGVVIGSEMSGGVKRVTISNCVFDGTNAGIRLKASRGRGGVVEQIRVDNIVMNDIVRDAFIFDLFYDKNSRPEPVSERTPIFRNIHISNVTGKDINRIGYLTGIEEMPIEEISFSNVNMEGKTGFTAKTGKNLRFDNVSFTVEKGPSFSFEDCLDVITNDVRSKKPIEGQEVVVFK